MANLRQLDLSLLDWEARAVLQALSAEAARLRKIAETSDDEDVAADAGNDCMEFEGLLDRLTQQASSVFGSQITTFVGKAL